MFCNDWVNVRCVLVLKGLKLTSAVVFIVDVQDDTEDTYTGASAFTPRNVQVVEFRVEFERVLSVRILCQCVNCGNVDDITLTHVLHDTLGICFNR